VRLPAIARGVTHRTAVFSEKPHINRSSGSRRNAKEERQETMSANWAAHLLFGLIVSLSGLAFFAPFVIGQLVPPGVA
jgi:hypothetical protein